ncbi:hypothetical protein Tco_1297380, partial [Tanacetum coccineum]
MVQEYESVLKSLKSFFQDLDIKIVESSHHKSFEFLFGQAFNLNRGYRIENGVKDEFLKNIDKLEKFHECESKKYFQEGKSNSPGNDTDVEGAKISKNDSDNDITIAKSSHDKNKIEVQWSNNGLFEHDHEVEKTNENNKVLKEANDLLTKELKTYKEKLSDKEDKYLNDILQLQSKNKDLENVVCNMGKSTETLRLLTNEQRAYRDNIRMSGLGYKGPCVLSQAYAKIPKLYSAYELHDENVQLNVFDSEKTLEDAEKSRLKMKEFQKDEKVQELKIKPIDYTNLNNLYET